MREFDETDPGKSDMDYIRGMFYTKGNLFIWHGNFFHDTVIDKFKIKAPDHDDSFKFSWRKENPYLSIENHFMDEFFNEGKHPEELKRLRTAIPSVFDNKTGIPRFERQFLKADEYDAGNK